MLKQKKNKKRSEKKTGMDAYRNDVYGNKISSRHHVNTQMQRTAPNISLISSAVIFSSYTNIFVAFHPPPFVRLSTIRGSLKILFAVFLSVH